jgi:hypothetical protein
MGVSEAHLFDHLPLRTRLAREHLARLRGEHRESTKVPIGCGRNK